jgi:hypothetical protein
MILREYVNMESSHAAHGLAGTPHDLERIRVFDYGECRSGFTLGVPRRRLIDVLVLVLLRPCAGTRPGSAHLLLPTNLNL